MKKMISILLCCLLLAMGAQALAEAAEDGAYIGQHRTFEEFVVGMITPPSGAFFSDLWGNNTTDYDIRVLLHGYSPIYWSKQTTYELNYQVLKSCTVGEYESGNKVYILELNQDLRYNDGSTISAADYAFSFLLQAHPAMTALGANPSGLDFIVGFDAYNNGQTNVLTGVRLIDQWTFSIEVKAEYLPFFYELSMLDVEPYPISVIAPGCEVVDSDRGVKVQNVGGAIGTPPLTKALLEKTVMDPNTGYLSHPSVTSGPYSLASYDAGTGIAKFTINPYYKGTYDGAKPTIDNLVVKPVTSDNMVEMLKTGQVQLLNRVANGQNIDDCMAVLPEVSASATNYPRMGFGFLSFNAASGPFQSEAVRKAVAYSLNTEQFCEAFSPYAVPVYGYMGMGQWMYQRVNQEEEPGEEESQAEKDRWAALSLDVLNKYEMDLDRAEQLLIDDGWTLNSNGGTYTKGTDSIRYKNVDGQLEGLVIRWGRTQGSYAAEELEAVLPDALAQIGISLQIVEAPFADVYQDYYAGADSKYDMLYLATDFRSYFDPSKEFGTDAAHLGIYNTSGLQDPKLEQLALDMRATEPGDLITYAEKWLSFQEYWNEKLPMLPLYSNVLFDFYVTELRNYQLGKEAGWSSAIVYAYTTEDAPEWLGTQGTGGNALEESEVPGV